jgi:hypothetical protein
MGTICEVATPPASGRFYGRRLRFSWCGKRKENLALAEPFGRGAAERKTVGKTLPLAHPHFSWPMLQFSFRT